MGSVSHHLDLVDAGTPRTPGTASRKPDVRVKLFASAIGLPPLPPLRPLISDLMMNLLQGKEGKM